MAAGALLHQDPSALTDESRRDVIRDVGRVGSGWVAFAGTYLAIAGLLNPIWGITALSNKGYFHENGLVWSSLSTWGWIAIIVAAVQIIGRRADLRPQVGGMIMGLVSRCAACCSTSSRSAPTRSGRCVAIVCNALVLWAVTVHGDDFAWREPRGVRWSPGRLEAFSDGVFAIAITLLVLEIRIDPAEFDHLWRALADEWPSYLAYVTSFLTMGGVWLAHHRLIRTCGRSTRC